MKRVLIAAAVVAGCVGTAYAAAPEFVQACCECCKDMIECCCGHEHG